MQVVKVKMSYVVQICSLSRTFARDVDHLQTQSIETFSKHMFADLNHTLPKLRGFLLSLTVAGYLITGFSQALEILENLENH